MDRYIKVGEHILDFKKVRGAHTRENHLALLDKDDIILNTYSYSTAEADQKALCTVAEILNKRRKIRKVLKQMSAL